MEIHFFHITWATYNTRMSARMKTYKVKLGKPVLLSMDEEAEIAGYVHQTVKKHKLRILAFNICVHHVHIIILCDINERDNIIQKIKLNSSKKYLSRLRSTQKVFKQKSIAEIPKHLWAQKFNWTCVLSDEQLSALYDYVLNNRIKHNLPVNQKLEEIIKKIVTPYNKIFDGIDFGVYP